jgi:hypothetical protein
VGVQKRSFERQELVKPPFRVMVLSQSEQPTRYAGLIGNNHDDEIVIVQLPDCLSASG